MSARPQVVALSAPELAAWLAVPAAAGGQAQPQLLDVREDWEYEYCRIPGSIHVPLGQLDQALERLDEALPVVCVCHHGMRSMRAAQYLLSQGYETVYNLTGGVQAWACTVDTRMPQY